MSESMNESQIIFDAVSKAGVAGILCLAVMYVAKKLASTYESRISALERATEVCEKDRVELRNMIIQAKFGGKTGETFHVKPPTKN
jgi:hypothetical protein